MLRGWAAGHPHLPRSHPLPDDLASAAPMSFEELCDEVWLGWSQQAALRRANSEYKDVIALLAGWAESWLAPSHCKTVRKHPEIRSVLLCLSAVAGALELKMNPAGRVHKLIICSLPVAEHHAFYGNVSALARRESAAIFAARHPQEPFLSWEGSVEQHGPHSRTVLYNWGHSSGRY